MPPAYPVATGIAYEARGIAGLDPHQQETLARGPSLVDHGTDIDRLVDRFSGQQSGLTAEQMITGIKPSIIGLGDE